MGRLSLGVGLLLVGALVTGGAARAQPPAAKPAAAPPPADADWKKQLAVSVELGPGGVLAPYTPNPGPNDLLFMTAVRVGYDVAPQWAGSLVLRQWWLPTDDHAFMFGPGARFEPYQLSFGRVFVDGSVGLVSTRHSWTVGLDLGGGFEWDVPDAPGLSLGPALRFGYVSNPNDQNSDDGAAWSIGASITYHFGEANAATTSGQKKRGKIKVTLIDTDRDGISDESDECPKEPQGKHPDQFRIGCPETDSDEDGIPDTEDPCPTLPPGEIPDPNRVGCPINDEDGDGVPDSEDACPGKKGVGSSDPVHNGCPAKKQPKAEPDEAPPETPEGLTPIKTRKRKMK
jgi:hypothetical protein